MTNKPGFNEVPEDWDELTDEQKDAVTSELLKQAVAELPKAKRRTFQTPAS
jgi:hypothetical protein